MGKFAEGTEVPPERSRAEIESIVRRYGAGQFISGYCEDKAMIGFMMRNRKVQFVVEMPSLAEFRLTKRGQARTKDQQVSAQLAEERRRWRCLALAIKAKLEAVDSGIMTFEDEFLAHIVLPNGATVSEHVRPAIEAAYTTGRMPPLLPDFSGWGSGAGGGEARP